MSLAGWWTARRRRSPFEGAAETTAPSSAGPARAASVEGSLIVESATIDAVAESPAERQLRFFSWLVGVVPGTGPTPCPVIGQMLEQIDAITTSESLRAGLLPRAPHVVPQLMKTLRDEHYSSVDVASRISKDVVLTAEVVRSATSAFQRGDDEGEIDLPRAVTMIGTQGLRRAIANVVLRPIFDAKGDTFSARAANQIWKDADRKARLCAALVTPEIGDPFDGYLAGLLHNTGWTALLRAIDGFEDMALNGAQLAHPEVIPQLLQRRDALFGAIVGPWNLSAAVDGLAADVGRNGVEGVQSPLGLALRQADRLAALRALTPVGQGPGVTVPTWATLPKAVRDCYAGLAAH